MNFEQAIAEIDHQSNRFGHWMEINFTSLNPFLVLWAHMMMQWHVRRLERAVERIAEILEVDIGE